MSVLQAFVVDEAFVDDKKDMLNMFYFESTAKLER